MMNYAILFVVLCLFCAAPTHAQEEEPLPEIAHKHGIRRVVAHDTTMADSLVPLQRTAWNNVYLEALGSGLIGSLNYERLLSEQFFIRIGILHVRFIEKDSNPYTVLTGGIGYLFGETNHKFEFGVGITNDWC